MAEVLTYNQLEDEVESLKEKLREASVTAQRWQGVVEGRVKRDVEMTRFNTWSEREYSKLSIWYSWFRASVRDYPGMFGPKSQDVLKQVNNSRMYAYNILTKELVPLHLKLAAVRYESLTPAEKTEKIEGLLKLEKPIASRFAFQIMRGNLWVETLKPAVDLVRNHGQAAP